MSRLLPSLVKGLAGTATSSLLPPLLLFTLALLTCLDALGLCGMPRLLPGLANGLAGRSPALLIWEGRRTKGLAFSGDREPALIGDQLEEGVLVGELVGVAALTVAGEAEFWRRKGDWRPVSWKERGRAMLFSLL